MNNLNVIGRLTRDVELRYTPNGVAVCKGTIAVDKGLSREVKEQWESQGKPTADFIPFTAWSGTAEVLANFTEKGCMIGITGSLHSSNWIDKETGKKMFGLDVNVISVDILEWKQEKQQTNNNYNKQNVYKR